MPVPFRGDLLRRYASQGPSYTLNTESSCTEIVKKSKFISKAAPASSFECAMAYLDRIKDDKANHNCWAYRSATTSRCSDDGEPGGTAGRPILNVLETEQLVDAVVVVTRFFGGIKLGSGGLVRAYGGAAKSAVTLAGKSVVVPHSSVKVTVPGEEVGVVYNIIQQSSGQNNSPLYKKISEEFVTKEGGADGQETIDVEFFISVPTAQIDVFRQLISSGCKGKEAISVEVDDVLGLS